jgi:hypothetical protein
MLARMVYSGGGEGKQTKYNALFDMIRNIFSEISKPSDVDLNNNLLAKFSNYSHTRFFPVHVYSFLLRKMKNDMFFGVLFIVKLGKKIPHTKKMIFNLFFNISLYHPLQIFPFYVFP